MNDQNSDPAQGWASNHDQDGDGPPPYPGRSRSVMKVGKQATEAFLEAREERVEAIRDGATIRERSLQAGVPERTVTTPGLALRV